jgi:ribosomal protein S18 acetylase RimI-like enzyme
MADKRPGFGALTSKTVARLRARGAREVASTWFTMLWQLNSSEQKLIFLHRDLGSRASAIGRSVPAGVTFKEADEGDAYQYARDIGTDSRATFTRRLSKDTRCFLVVGDGVILHASWVTTAAAWTRELQRYFCPPASEAYIYESYTRPETRGRGIYPFALDSMCDWMRARQLRRAWVGIEHGNAASEQAIRKASFEPGFEVRYRRRFARLSVSAAEGPAARPDHHFLSTAPNCHPI